MEERLSSLETTIKDPNSVLNVNCLLVSDIPNRFYRCTRYLSLYKYLTTFKLALCAKYQMLRGTQYLKVE